MNLRFFLLGFFKESATDKKLVRQLQANINLFMPLNIYSNLKSLEIFSSQKLDQVMTLWMLKAYLVNSKDIIK